MALTVRPINRLKNKFYIFVLFYSQLTFAEEFQVSTYFLMKNQILANRYGFTRKYFRVHPQTHGNELFVDPINPCDTLLVKKIFTYPPWRIDSNIRPIPEGQMPAILPIQSAFKDAYRYGQSNRDSILYKEIVKALLFSHHRFIASSGFSLTTLDKFLKRESSLALGQLGYIILSDPQNNPFAILRIYNGFPSPTAPKTNLLLMEKSLQNGTFRVPRRLLYLKKSLPFFPLELGRFSINKDYKSVIPVMLHFTARHLEDIVSEHYYKTQPSDLEMATEGENIYLNQVWIYFEAEENLLDYYKDLGFKVINGPFSESVQDPKVFIFEMNGSEFHSKFINYDKELSGFSIEKEVF